MLRLFTDWLPQNRRLLIVVAICAALAANFWAGSRIPSLNDKATMGGDLILEDPLGFEAAYPVDPNDPTMQRIFFTTLNWISTNRQGMTFGILIAAGFMTLLSLLQRRSFSSHFGNTVLGLFIGAPLGVCVNCAAPIARGLHDSGARLETTLATMISSPTLNIIVLTMLFSLMPLYMAVTKVAMTLLFLLVVVPLLARYMFSDMLVSQSITLPEPGAFAAGSSEQEDQDILRDMTSEEPNWWASVIWVAKKYAVNLIYIIKLTVPLMLLAGIMGSVAITLFPWQDMADLFIGSQWYLLAVGAVLIAAVGLFLPVPIAFDVAIVTAMLAGGLPPLFAMTLLFTLGIFSIYSFFIVWTGISRRLAWVLSGMLFLMGLASGAVVELYLILDESDQQELFEEFDLGSNIDSVSGFFFGSAWAATRDASTKTFPSDVPGVRITETAMQQSSPPADKLFTRRYGEELGLLNDPDLSLTYKFVGPFQRSWPVASADIDTDGWVDLVVGNGEGISLYRNVQGRRFERLPLVIPGEKIRIINLALVDLNNDRLPDLFFSLYRRGNHVFLNRDGAFTVDGHIPLPRLDTTITDATAFGDLDLDGDIDIATGNWTAGPWTRIPDEASRNAILWKQTDGYEVERLPGIPGETLAILISDINQDGFPDLMVGNDFEIPEFYYFGQAGGKLKPIKRSENIFPVTTFSTMSIDSGDIDNDLDLEIYTTQASGFTSSIPTERASMLPLQPIAVVCDEYEDNAWRQRCLKRLRLHEIMSRARLKRNPRVCLEIEDQEELRGCLAYQLLEKSVLIDRNPELCPRLEKNWPDFAYICKRAHQAIPKYAREQVQETLRQKLGRNMLYTPTEDGAYRELAEEMDADITGWSWAAKFADLDNDEWQDLYVVNGQFQSQKRSTNVFFRNEQGKRFANDTREAGLENYLAMSSFTYIDYDNDTDLDIVATSDDGPIWVYTNNTQGSAGIIFELIDGIGNRAGIGSRIIIHYGDAGEKHQIREIKAGGGFLSFDAPRAHFGLGEHRVVSRVEVIWSIGETTELSGEFKAGHKYVVERVGA